MKKIIELVLFDDNPHHDSIEEQQRHIFLKEIKKQWKILILIDHLKYNMASPYAINYMIILKGKRLGTALEDENIIVDILPQEIEENILKLITQKQNLFKDENKDFTIRKIAKELKENTICLKINKKVELSILSSIKNFLFKAKQQSFYKINEDKIPSLIKDINNFS